MESANQSSSKRMIMIEVAYALPDKQEIITLQVEEGTTVEQGITQSNIISHFPEIDLSKSKIGIFSKMTKKDVVLREGDRIEIYRPLIADQKKVRKERAAKSKKTKKGGDK